MDFTPSEELREIRKLARRILTDVVTDDALKAHDREGHAYHQRAWQELGRSELLGVALPASLGGGEMSAVELAAVLEEVGRAAAPIPVAATLALAVEPLARSGHAAARELIAATLAEGPVVAGAWAEADSRNPLAPTTTARRDGDRVIINGTKIAVEGGTVARHFVITATLDGAPTLLLVPRDADGVTVVARRATNFAPVAELQLRDVAVPGSAVLDGAAPLIAACMDLYLLLQSAQMLGLADRALELTAEYVTRRTQFGVPIATFQAVSQRTGDCYIDVQAMRLMVQRAAWRLGTGREATREIRVARFTAAEGGHRVVSAAQHLHGGMGFDKDYPLHRYFLTMKQLEFACGGANAQLAELGRMVREQALAEIA